MRILEVMGQAHVMGKLRGRTIKRSRDKNGKAAAATNLPLYMTQERATTVFLMTLTMCAISGLLAMRKVRKLDPAEVF